MIALSSKLKSIICIFALGYSGMTFAAPASDAAIDKLITLSELEFVFEQSLQGLQPFFEQESEQLVMNLANTTTLNANQLAIAQQLSQAMANVTEDALKDPLFKDKLKQTLKSTYTDKEVTAYNKFLSTPEGQSINRKSPKVTIEIQKFMEEIIAKSTQSKVFDQQVEKIISPLLER